MEREISQELIQRGLFEFVDKSLADIANLYNLLKDIQSGCLDSFDHNELSGRFERVVKDSEKWYGTFYNR